MPRDSAGNYTLPPNAILGCSPGQALTSDWQNTTFADIYNGFNQGTINTNITALPTFDANNQIIRAKNIASINGNLKLQMNLTSSGVPKGVMFYHDSRYKPTHHKKITKSSNNLDLVCQDKIMEHL